MDRTTNVVPTRVKVKNKGRIVFIVTAETEEINVIDINVNIKTIGKTINGTIIFVAVLRVH